MNNLKKRLTAIALASGLTACGGGNDGTYIYAYEQVAGYYPDASSVYISRSLQNWLVSRGVIILSVDECLGIPESNGEFPMRGYPAIELPPRLAQPEAPYMYFAFRVLDDAAAYSVLTLTAEEETAIPPRDRRFRDTPLSATSKANSMPIPCGT